jgi:hypothetical protein
MPESTFTFRVDDELEAAFAEVAATQELAAAPLLRVLMTDAAHRDRGSEGHDRWFRGEITHALSDRRRPCRPSCGGPAGRSSRDRAAWSCRRRPGGRGRRNTASRDLPGRSSRRVGAAPPSWWTALATHLSHQSTPSTTQDASPAPPSGSQAAMALARAPRCRAMRLARRSARIAAPTASPGPARLGGEQRYSARRVLQERAVGPGGRKRSMHREGSRSRVISAAAHLPHG